MKSLILWCVSLLLCVEVHAATDMRQLLEALLCHELLDVNAKNMNGNVALHYFVRSWDAKNNVMCERLLQMFVWRGMLRLPHFPLLAHPCSPRIVSNSVRYEATLPLIFGRNECELQE